jgi:hypothetical protein
VTVPCSTPVDGAPVDGIVDLAVGGGTNVRTAGGEREHIPGNGVGAPLCRR